MATETRCAALAWHLGMHKREAMFPGSAGMYSCIQPTLPVQSNCARQDLGHCRGPGLGAEWPESEVKNSPRFKEKLAPNVAKRLAGRSGGPEHHAKASGYMSFLGTQQTLMPSCGSASSRGGLGPGQAKDWAKGQALSGSFDRTLLLWDLENEKATGSG